MWDVVMPNHLVCILYVHVCKSNSILDQGFILGKRVSHSAVSLSLVLVCSKLHIHMLKSPNIFGTSMPDLI